MMIRNRSGAFLFSTAVVLTLGSLPLLAQEPQTAKPATPPQAQEARPAYDPARRVPPYFAQVGLTPEQRESIYKVRGREDFRFS
jgi:hypothetical protein